MRFQRRSRMAMGAITLAGILALASASPQAAAAEDYAKQTCGGLVGKGCPAGMFCQMPAGMCRGADIQGTCEKVPTICNKIFMPVCGCNGKTYGNDCERQAAKASKDHDGPCK